MEPVQQLLDIEEIKVLKARYFRYLDTKDWEAWRTLFTDNAYFAIEGMTPTSNEVVELHSGDAIVANAVWGLTNGISVHQGHMPEIEIRSETEAHGIFAMFDWGDTAIEGERVLFQGYGHYHDDFRKVDGEWLIDRMRLTRIRVDSLLQESNS